jgi:hypothetical protein
MRTEHATGRVEGSCQTGSARAQVDIVYTYDNGAPSDRAGYSARLSCDAYGRVVGISWSNNSSYTRVQ